MVCVRKKDGGLGLCVDYRELNRKTYPERQPIPRIQDILNELGDNSLFTVLDKGRPPTTRASWQKRAEPLPLFSHQGDNIRIFLDDCPGVLSEVYGRN